MKTETLIKVSQNAKRAREEKLIRNRSIANYIDAVVCSYFKCQIASIEEHKRKGKITKPRQFAMYFCGTYTDLGISLIGQRYGFRHDIAHYYIKRTEFDIISDLERKKAFVEINRKIQAFVEHREMERGV